MSEPTNQPTLWKCHFSPTNPFISLLHPKNQPTNLPVLFKKRRPPQKTTAVSKQTTQPSGVSQQHGAFEVVQKVRSLAKKVQNERERAPGSVVELVVREGGLGWRLVGWLVGWLVDWLVDWLVGWLITEEDFVSFLKWKVNTKMVGWLVDIRKLFDPVDGRNPAFTNGG